MAETNTKENQIHIGENIRVISPLTDAAGAPVPFANLLTISGTAFDEFGNSQDLVIVVDGITPDPNALTYEIETSNMLEGKISVRLNMTFNSPSFPTSFARDIVEAEIFTLYK